VIRFGVVLTVVLAAMGLLAGGVLANRLLLVYLAIGAAALAAIMLTAGVLIWREEVFGPSSAAPASLAAKQAAGASPVLAATGVAQPGRSAGGPADVTTIGAAAQDDFVMEPPPPALPPRPDWAGRLEPQGYPDWPAPPQQQEQPDWRSDRPERQEQPDQARPSDRPEQPDWAKRSDAPERTEHLEPRKVADPAARQGSAGQERTSRSPSGAWPEPLAEPVPGPRQGDEPAPGGVPVASRGAAAADELKPRPAREPAAQSQGERDADVSAWSFFTKTGKPSVARPDLTQAVGAEAGAVRSGESAGPADGREPRESSGPGGSRELAESGEPGGSREADESPKSARTAEAAAPDRAAADLAERDAPAGPAEPGPAEPEPVSAAAERAAPDDAAVAGPGTEDESPAGTAVRDAHAAQGPDAEVTVVPGITRYHRSQCILIRFLGPEDLQTMTLQAAEMASYVPCKACRPEQVLAR